MDGVMYCLSPEVRDVARRDTSIDVVYPAHALRGFSQRRLSVLIVFAGTSLKKMGWLTLGITETAGYVLEKD
jgi:hypothetical protein